MTVIAVGLSGCGSPSTKKISTITVFAAASLQEPFTKLAKTYQASHPGITIRLNFAGSPSLVTAVNQGAPVDVLATASKATMDHVSSAVSPIVFATNTMAIAVPKTTPSQVASLADLGKVGVKVALCQATVPCGALAQEVLTKAKVKVTPVTQENNVSGVLTKVKLGEVDAGLVYVTDVRGNTAIREISIPRAVNAVTTYPIAVLATSPLRAEAAAFVAFILSPKVQHTLADEGWGRP